MSAPKTEEKVVVPIKTDCICMACDKGRYRPTGLVLDRMPPLFEHSCNQCGDMQNFEVTFPHIRWDDLEELIEDG